MKINNNTNLIPKIMQMKVVLNNIKYCNYIRQLHSLRTSLINHMKKSMPKQ